MVIKNISAFMVQVIENFFIYEYEDVENEVNQASCYSKDDILNQD